MMLAMSDEDDIRAAVAGFDLSSTDASVPAAEEERRRVLSEFPLADWSALPLESYALGQHPTGRTATYCRLMEFGTPILGSIKGGSAAKHIMYRHNSGEWRLAAPLRAMEPQDAWARLRDQFVRAFEAVRHGDFEALEDLELLRYGPALVTKSLATYFPDAFLPVYSADHLRRFISLLGGRIDASAPTWSLNRHLRELVRNRAEFDGWSGLAVMEFLYAGWDPRPTQRTIWKIAPGQRARLWPECLEGKFICVAWDELGDLGQYQTDRELKEALDHHAPESAGGNLNIARRLLAFRDLEPGDQVVANRGTTEVLATGTVTEPYRFDEQRPEYRHLVSVDWDTSKARMLARPRHGWQSTFARVPPALFAEINAGASPAITNDTNKAALPEDVQAVLSALERKGQVILHGPPGTGKTRLAFNAALAIGGKSAAIGAVPTERTKQVIDLLEHEPWAQLVTFHPSYGYEDFVEGFKPDVDATGPGLTLLLAKGLFHRLCDQARADPGRTYLLIIDEINRGDLPRIFGELITLLELDKRGVPLSLPISRDSFSVPPNVRIIATMNTADRSISHLDAAVRRRFAFLSVDPDPDAVSGTIGPLDLAEFLTSLNARIARHLDADHQIGHAYLLRDDEPIASEQDLAAVFHDDLVPLLEDACVGQAELLHHILGSLVDPDTGRQKMMAPQDLVASLTSEFSTGGSVLDA